MTNLDRSSRSVPLPKTALRPLLATLLPAGCASGRPPRITPPGGEKTTGTEVLETGAALLQTQAPLRPMDVYLVGFHAASNPSIQMEVHHYCHQVNADFMQCALFDGNTEEANLIGIEYIDTMEKRLKV
jgi:hypothetical protein